MNSYELTQKILEISIAIANEKNHLALLEKILDESMSISACDGGTLYIYKEDKLNFFIMRTLSQGVNKGGRGEKISLPPVDIRESSVAGYAALHRRTVNVPDVYHDNAFDWAGPKKYDSLTGYHTQSILVIPLVDQNDELIGVMQLINALSDGQIVPFDRVVQDTLTSLASLCSIVLSNMLLLDNIKALLDSFVKSMITAIDARSPYTANHSQHVTSLCERYVDFLNERGYISISPNERDELIMAAMLHDIGKMAISADVLNKSSRLDGKLPTMRMRWQVIQLAVENSFLSGKLDEQEYSHTMADFRESCEFIERINSVGFINDDDMARIDSIAHLSFDTPFGEMGIIMGTEIDDVHIRKGTLTNEERAEIEKHVVYTAKILSEIEFGKKYSHVSFIAGAHHEHIDGTGYPNRLSAAELPFVVRILTVMDIYESLTSSDRPYKKPFSAEKAYSILTDMVRVGKLDGSIVQPMAEFLQIK